MPASMAAVRWPAGELVIWIDLDLMDDAILAFSRALHLAMDIAAFRGLAPRGTLAVLRWCLTRFFVLSLPSD
jgi:hypothetical protein